MSATSRPGSAAPAIDAEVAGATKFHVGGVLKVKVDDEGTHIYGSSTFDGDAVFNAGVQFNSFVNASRSSDTTFEGNVKYSEDSSVVFETDMHVLQPVRYGAVSRTVELRDGLRSLVTANAIAGTVTGPETALLAADTPLEIELNNTFIDADSFVMATAHECGRVGTSDINPVLVNVGDAVDGSVTIQLYAEYACTNPYLFNFVVFGTARQPIPQPPAPPTEPPGP